MVCLHKLHLYNKLQPDRLCFGFFKWLNLFSKLCVGNWHLWIAFMSVYSRCIFLSSYFLSQWFYAAANSTARPKAWTVFARSNTGIVGSNPTRGMDNTDVCVRLFYVYVVLCVGSDLATCWSSIQGVVPTVYRLREWKSDEGPQGL
jgi:hypothetical protein